MAGGAAELIERVMRVHGIDPDERGAVPQLARITGLPERGLYRWMERTPSFENTIELLERAGMLREKPAKPTAIEVEEEVIALLASRRMTRDRAALAEVLASELEERAQLNLSLASRLRELASRVSS